jgi:hypothetical protein
LRYGNRRAIETKKDTYAIVRAYAEDRVLIAFNRSQKPVSLDLLVSPEIPDGPLEQELLLSKTSSAKNISVKYGRLTLSLPPRSSSIFVPAKP